MRNKGLVIKTLFIVFAATVILNVYASKAFALPGYVSVSSNSSSTVYDMPSSSSLVIGSIGVETVKVYWQEAGYYYIEYVVSSGAYGGYKRGYVPTSKITVPGIGGPAYASWSSKTFSNQTVYDRSTTNSLVVGTVYSTDPITVLQEDGSWYFIEYPITGGHKRGYVPKSTVQGPPSGTDYLYLNVQGIKQEQTNWCWAATSKSIIDYLRGTNPSQSDIVTSIFGSPVNQGAFPTQDAASLNNFGVTTTATNSSISFSTVKDNIKGWYSPIKASIYWTSGGGHDLVIYGYYEDSSVQEVTYMDPWPTNDTWNIRTYSSFVSNPSWTWNWTYYWNF